MGTKSSQTGLCGPVCGPQASRGRTMSWLGVSSTHMIWNWVLIRLCSATSSAFSRMRAKPASRPPRPYAARLPTTVLTTMKGMPAPGRHERQPYLLAVRKPGGGSRCTGQNSGGVVGGWGVQAIGHVCCVEAPVCHKEGHLQGARAGQEVSEACAGQHAARAHVAEGQQLVQKQHKEHECKPLLRVQVVLGQVKEHQACAQGPL